MVGNLDKYMQYQTGVALEAGASNPGGGAGAGIGMGAGLAMGQQMANSMGQGRPPQDGRNWHDDGRRVQSNPPTARALPPPLPGGTRYHVAIDGEASGPYSVEGLQQQLSNGVVKPDTLVWASGMGDWQEASKVDELSGLFRAPPPLPHG